MNAMMTKEADIHIFTLHEYFSSFFSHHIHICIYILIPNGNFQPKILSIDAERMYANDHTGIKNKESTQQKNPTEHVECD